jgi:hypothetical protein
VHFVLRLSAGDSVPLASVSFKGLNSQSITTNQDGGFDLTLSLSEKVTFDQFSVQNLLVKTIILSDKENVVVVDRPKIAEAVHKKKAS